MSQLNLFRLLTLKQSAKAKISKSMQLVAKALCLIFEKIPIMFKKANEDRQLRAFWRYFSKNLLFFTNRL